MARWLSWLERRPVTAEVDGSNPFRVVCMFTCKTIYMQFGVLAQLGEHLPYKQRVTGSSPVGPICIISGCGGIGRHKGLKIPRTYHPCRFKSGHPHGWRRTEQSMFRFCAVYICWIGKQVIKLRYLTGIQEEFIIR